MYRPIRNAVLLIAAIVPLASFAIAASNHLIWPTSAIQAKKHSLNISQSHPYLAVPALSAGKGWYSANSLSPPATVTAEANWNDLSLCRMTAYPPEYVAAFEAVCSKGATVAFKNDAKGSL
jgi:hypothetical protein